MSPSTLIAALSPIGSVSIGFSLLFRLRRETLIWDLMAGGLERVLKGLAEEEEPLWLV